MLLYSPNDKVSYKMLQMKYNPDKGLGKKWKRTERTHYGKKKKKENRNWLTKFITLAIVSKAADPIICKNDDPVWVER